MRIKVVVVVVWNHSSTEWVVFTLQNDVVKRAMIVIEMVERAQSSLLVQTVGAHGPQRHPSMWKSRGNGEHVSVQAPKR
jgi:hypothetical protein